MPKLLDLYLSFPNRWLNLYFHIYILPPLHSVLIVINFSPLSDDAMWLIPLFQCTYFLCLKYLFTSFLLHNLEFSSNVISPPVHFISVQSSKGDHNYIPCFLTIFRYLSDCLSSASLSFYMLNQRYRFQCNVKHY